MYEKIPFELRALRQWVLWRYVTLDNGTITKIPFMTDGRHADTSNAATWSAFADVAMSVSNGYNGIGFVFSKDDPYCGIDLDKIMEQSLNVQNIHRSIFEKFESYSEWSPSGAGIHIIVRATVPSGRNDRTKGCEIYSEGRYFTFTGDAIRNVQIAERNDLAQILWGELGGSSRESAFRLVEQFARPQEREDAAIYDVASGAHNGAKFRALWAGDWSVYPSQSEADIALINILQFYSKNPNQIIRLFLMSGLGQRDKARRDDYVPRMVARAFDRELPPVAFDFGPVPTSTAQERARALVPVDEAAKGSPFTPPPGVMGDIARFIYAAAPRPVAEAALAGAMVMFAGLVGKAFNVSGTGLNHYVLFLAPTATGKEQIARGVGKLMSALNMYCPTVMDFQAPSKFASGQGLIRSIKESKTGGSMFSIAGEFGIKMQIMASDKASPPDKMLLAELLDLYNKSGKDDIVTGTAYSDSGKNIASISGPAFSMLGEGVPQSFYTLIDERTVLSGLLPRFTVVEYNGSRVAENRGHNQVKPDESLLLKLSEIVNIVMGRIRHNAICNVEFDQETQSLDWEFDHECDSLINLSSRAVVRALWSRARVKVMKLAALVAVGINHNAPIITRENYLWAQGIVRHETEAMIKKFETGQLARDTENLENEQLYTMVKTLHKILSTNVRNFRGFRTTGAMLKDNVIVLSDISMRMSSIAVFKKDTRKDHSQKINRAIESMKQAGLFAEVNGSADGEKYGYKGRMIKLLDYDLLTSFMHEEV